MPCKGQIWLYKEYEFEDGTKRDKYFIAIQDMYKSKKECLFLITTSSYWRFIPDIKAGCNAEMYLFFIPNKWGTYFKKDTYVLLNFNSVKSFKITNIPSNTFFSVGDLSPEHYAQLKNCLYKCKDRIPMMYHTMIFK